MSRFLLTLTVLVLIAAPAAALKCYVCTGDDESCSKSKLEDNKATYLRTCLSDRCIRTWDKHKDTTLVTSGCSSQSLCDTEKFACETKEDNLKDYECAVGCCSDDGCNAGSAIAINVILVIVCSVLGLALLK